MPLLLFLAAIIVLLAGFPVVFSLSGVALAFAALGMITGTFDAVFLEAIPNRIYGIMTNEVLIAVPLFVFMGVVLEKSRIADQLLDAMSSLMGRAKGGLSIAVTLVGMLMAASTGIVGATVVTMGLLSLPTMLKRGYDMKLATGTICAAGTLGQIIPPSIVLVLLGDVMSSAYQQAQLNIGIFTPDTVSVGDLFMGALIPGLLLVILYMLYQFAAVWLKPELAPSTHDSIESKPSPGALLSALLPPLILILLVLGSILGGIATPTEAASVGALGSMLLAGFKKTLSWQTLKDIMRSTTQVSSMVFMILIGAAVFSLVFRGYGGDELVRELLTGLPGGLAGAFIVVMLVMFVLGFFLDFIEITFVVVPIVAPILLTMGLDPVWLGIMIALNLQTSFLTPPFGFALFYLRGVAPDSVTTGQIYRGVIPFIIIQLLLLGILAIWPQLATWLPDKVFG